MIASANIDSGFDKLKILTIGANAVRSEMPDYKISKYTGNEKKEISMYGYQDVVDFSRIF